MNERTTLEIIAPTVEEAISQGLAQLGLTADAVSVEVLDAGNKGLFGLGKPQVRVRLTVNPTTGVPNTQTEAAAGKTTSRRAAPEKKAEVETKVPERDVERVPAKPEPVHVKEIDS